MKKYKDKKENFIKIPKKEDSLSTYKEYAKKNMINVFQLDDTKDTPLQ
ncbi:MAG: hypothetical protein WCL02_08120 [bacterium]